MAPNDVMLHGSDGITGGEDWSQRLMDRAGIHSVRSRERPDLEFEFQEPASALFLWCGWYLQPGLSQPQLRRALVGLAGSGTLMWAFALAAKGSESDRWRLPIIVCIAGVG